MRPRRVVAGVALIAVLASVVVPVVAGARPSGPLQAIADEAYVPVAVPPDNGTSTAILLDPRAQSAGPLPLDGSFGDPEGVLRDPEPSAVPAVRPVGVQPAARATVIVKPLWIYDHELSWYGPNFYGQNTACGQVLTKTLLGVANRTLPCGTLVTFKWGSKTITVPVVDRGPYVSGRQWDLTAATCAALDHCWTGPIYYHLG